MSILTRLATVEHRLRILNKFHAATMAARFQQQIEAGAPEALYVRWTADLEHFAGMSERDERLLITAGLSAAEINRITNNSAATAR